MSSKAVVRYLGLILPLLWLFVNLMTSSTQRPCDGALCQGMTLSLWIEFHLMNDIEESGGLGMVSLLGLWIYGV